MSTTPVTTARIVTCNEGLGRTEHSSGIDRPPPRREARGHIFIGDSVRHRRRAELRNRPTLAGLDGPVWDGDAPCHKDAQACRRLPV